MVEYAKEGKIIVIKGCSDDEQEIVIPEYIEDLPVGKIEANAFNELSKLKRVVLPKNLRLIGSYAFAGCKNLKEVVFSEGLEVIEDWAFISCNIQSINIPSTIKQIGENAFMGNEAKNQINEFLAKKNIVKKTPKQRRYNATVFPAGLLESIENISCDIIDERAKYYAAQIDSFEEDSIKSTNLDLPFLFDGDDFIVALHTTHPLNTPSLELSKESKEKIGLYEDDDPDFLQLDINVMSDSSIVGELIIKVPYLEDISFQVLDVYTIEEKEYRYYLHVSTNMACYGNGNINREFAFDLFKELEGKYFTQLQNNLITSEVYDTIKNEIDDAAIDALKEFLKQVSGAPVLQYLMSIINAFLLDEELENDPIYEFVGTKLDSIYNTMGDYQSFENVCFDMKDATKFITEFTRMTLDDLKAKYDVYIQDDEGTPLTVEDIADYRGALIDNDFNYTLHAEFLNYIYQLMSKMNREYSMKTYQE